MISFIVAVDENNLMGKDNGLPWHLPADLRHFRKKTLEHVVIMGRKTFESMKKPLEKRENIIITRQPNYDAPGCFVFHSLREALEHSKNEDEAFIIGGAEIFRDAMPVADRIYLTRIHYTFEGDIYFPQINMDHWQMTEKETFRKDDKNPYDYSFITLERILKVGKQLKM